MQTVAKTIGVIVTVLIIVGIVFGFYDLLKVEDVPDNSLEARCEFVVKTSGSNFNISEPKAGTFKYELYATPDGFIEVWKCK